jgi:hypothetical protein
LGPPPEARNPWDSLGSSGANHRRDYRRALPGALLVSVAIHVIVLSWPSGIGVPQAIQHAGARNPGRSPPATMRAINIQPDELSAVARPSKAEEPQTPVASPVAAGQTNIPDLKGSADPGLAEDVAARFRPHWGDPRLWSRIAAPELSTTVAESERLRQRIEEDSQQRLGVKEVQAGDMSVWAGRDADGSRWGLSPGLIYLGGVTIPLCSGTFDASNCGFGVPPAFRDQHRADLRTLIELRRQGDRAALEERARAIRARLDSLRDTIRPHDWVQGASHPGSAFGILLREHNADPGPRGASRVARDP